MTEAGNMGKIKIGKKDVVWGYIGVIFSLGINIMLLPLILHYLDENEIGLWYIFLSINSMITLLDTSFSPSISRNMAYCWGGAEKLEAVGVQTVNPNKETNYELMVNVIYTSRKIYFIVALLAVFAMGTAGTAYVGFVARAIPKKVWMPAWALFAGAIFVNIYYGYYISLLNGSGAIKESNQAIVISRLLQILSAIVLLLLGYGLIGAVLSYVVYTISYRFFSKKAFLKFKGIGQILTTKTKPQHRDASEIFKIIWPNTKKEFLISLANFLTTQATTFLCSVYYSLAETGNYGTVLQVVTAIGGFAGTFYQIFQPELQEANVSKNRNRQKNLMSEAIFIYIIFYLSAIVLAYTVGVPVINYIKPTSPVDKKMILILGTYMFLFKHYSIYTSYISNSNRLPYVKAFLISAVCSVLLAVSFQYLVPDLGIYGLIMAQIIVLLCYNGWKWPLMVHRELDLNFWQLMKLGWTNYRKILSIKISSKKAL